MLDAVPLVPALEFDVLPAPPLPTVIVYPVPDATVNVVVINPPAPPPPESY
jgi:hypothetical protein